MSLNIPRKTKADIPPLDGGTYPAVCIGVIDLGTQYVQFGKEKNGHYEPQSILIFEIPSERVEIDGESKPRWISSRRYRNSLYATSALSKLLTSWRGRELTDDDFDPQKGDTFGLWQMAGQGAMLSLSVYKKDDGSTRNKIEAVTGFPKGIPVPEPESDILIFDADDPDMEVFGKLPEWIQNIIRKSTQFADNAPDEKVDIPPDQETKAEETAGEECPI